MPAPDDLARSLLLDAFGRVHQDLPGVLADLDRAAVLWRPDADANSIGWLIWHLARVQDDHVAGVGGIPQAWTSQGWYERFALPYPPQAHGYGHSTADVGAFTAGDAALLVAYHDAVHELTVAVVSALRLDDFARIVDRRWTPPVTAAVRLVSVVNDTMQHLGQAAYLRGLAERRRR